MTCKAGFTLIEALVALAIGAGVMAMAAQGFSLSVASVQRAELRQAQADAILAAHSVVRAKLAKLVSGPSTPITGATDSLAFTFAESGDTAPAGLYEARFTVEAADGWTLWLTRTPASGAASVREMIWRGDAQPSFTFDAADSFAGATPPRIVSLKFQGSSWPTLSLAPAGGARLDRPPPAPVTQPTEPVRDPSMEVPQ